MGIRIYIDVLIYCWVSAKTTGLVFVTGFLGHDGSILQLGVVVHRCTVSLVSHVRRVGEAHPVSIFTLYLYASETLFFFFFFSFFASHLNHG